MVENLSSSAGDAGSIFGWGTKIICAMGQLSLCRLCRLCRLQLLSLFAPEPKACNKDSRQPKINTLIKEIQEMEHLTVLEEFRSLGPKARFSRGWHGPTECSQLV